MSAATASRPNFGLTRGASSEFSWAPLAAVTLATSPAVDVYASTPGTEPKLLWRGNSRLGDSHLAEMRRYSGQFSFWVARGDYRRVADAVQTAWQEIVAGGSLTSCDRFALCELAYGLELSATLTLVKCEPFVAAAQRVGVDVARIFGDQPTSSLELFYTLQNGNGPTSRLMQVTGYTVQLALLCGVVDRGILEQIAAGALVHDVGARDMTVDVWANPARWDAEERESVERHPRRSYEMLLRQRSLSHEQLLMSYQHHERVDGCGYPVGILGREIHPWAKMLAVADRFQALTSGRVGRRALLLPEAVEQLACDATDSLDSEMTQCWIKSLTTK